MSFSSSTVSAASTTITSSGCSAGCSQRGEPLGFGLSEAVALVTPVVWIVVDEVARRSVGAAIGGVVPRVRSALRRLLRRPAVPPLSVPELSSDELGTVHRRILERAAAMGMERPLAERLADGVIARLATGRAEEPGDALPPPSPGSGEPAQ